jgi:DNA mismatch repair ATPase MutS
MSEGADQAVKAHLMYRDRDLDLQAKLPANDQALVSDLELNTLFNAMALGDEFLFQVAKQAMLSGLQTDLDTIHYRQAVLNDCSRNYSAIKTMYDIAAEAIKGEKKEWLSISRYPGGILYSATRLLELFMEKLGKLKSVADEHSARFESEGFRAFFALLKAELTDEYLARIKSHLEDLQFRRGVLISAGLGKGNRGIDYVLRKSLSEQPGWIQRMIAPKPSGYTFYIAHRDEAGAQALAQLRDRGLNLVANALAQSSDHILSFFVMLRAELAFYIGCVNLRRQLEQKGVPVCLPVPSTAGTGKHSAVGLRDVSLVLSFEQELVGNELNADGKNLVIITGANKGGKSTFLRGVGLAQLMMQCGLFVTAESFSADVCRSLFTHYKREEDVTMESGKFDEELSRMSDIIDALTPDSLLLFNESFAATNEREGSEVARQIVHALHEARTKILYVTHLYDFARGLWEEKIENALFLRAERQADGRRTFKLLPGEPLQTSFGIDLYKEIFAVSSAS